MKNLDEANLLLTMASKDVKALSGMNDPDIFDYEGFDMLGKPLERSQIIEEISSFVELVKQKIAE